MDYKELIRISKKAEDEWRNDHTFYQAGTPIDSLCDAIETLLAERDAAVKDLHGDCRCCANNTGWHNIGKCITCLHETAPITLPEFNRIDNWQWRGPQKEGGDG